MHADKFLANMVLITFHFVADPTMTVAFQWPRGQFTILKAASGCPTGMSSGWRLQDNENNGNKNHWRPSDIQFCIDFGVGRNLKTYYCTKLSRPGSPSWPSGTYCIARYGDSCPSGFFPGKISWDDENFNNFNSKMYPIPSGVYDRDTEINFCCRSDGMGHYHSTIHHYPVNCVHIEL